MEKNIKFSRGEELANAISHLSGALLAVVALVLMVHFSIVYGNGWHVVSTSIFGSSMIVLYISSTMTHILPMGRAKDRFFNFDRIAIYLLIAGTYTPIALLTLHPYIRQEVQFDLLSPIALTLFTPSTLYVEAEVTCCVS